jgi:hypothetical protein
VPVYHVISNYKEQGLMPDLQQISNGFMATTILVSGHAPTNGGCSARYVFSRLISFVKQLSSQRPTGSTLMEGDTANRAKYELFGLPRELRDLIYHFILTHPSLYIIDRNLHRGTPPATTLYIQRRLRRPQSTQICVYKIVRGDKRS